MTFDVRSGMNVQRHEKIKPNLINLNLCKLVVKIIRKKSRIKINKPNVQQYERKKKLLKVLRAVGFGGV